LERYCKREGVGFSCQETKNEGNVLKIVSLGLEPRVYDAMKKPDFSAEKLAREFRSEGVEISAPSVRKFIKKTQKAQQELIAKDVRASTEIMKTAMDYNTALREILDEVKDVKNEAMTEKDFTTYNQLVGRLLQGIELFAKLTGDMKPKGNVDIKIIYNQITDDVEVGMKNARKEMFDNMRVIDVDTEIVDEDKEVSRKIQEGEKYE